MNRDLTKMIILALVVALTFISVGSGQTALAATDCTFTTTGDTMTLDGDCTTDETIVIPDGVTLDGAGHTITAVDPSGGHFMGAVVANAGSTAHVKRLTVTASGLSNVCDGGADRLRGIMFEGASGSITHNTVTGIHQGASSGCQEGNGIEVRNAPFDGTHPNTEKVTISHNTVFDYQKNGITANGDVNASITTNTVTGFGPVNSIAQNGIQVGFGARGKVMKNTVNGSWFTGANWTASGILIFESDNAVVQDNSASGNQSGIVVEAWCWFAPSASNNKIVQNVLSGADFGVSVGAFVLGSGLSNCDPSANNNKVVNNSITASSGDTGIFVGTGFFFGGESTEFNPSANNNKVIHNEISGYTTDVVDEGTATKTHANVLAP